ncbi:MAG: thiolase family protein [Pseudomonadota bacterium]
MNNAAYIIGALRTPVAPARGDYAALNATTLGQLTIEGLLKKLDLPAEFVEHCVFSNALYAGGNPTRLSALAAQIPEVVPSMTIDTQCCGGLDSLIVASSLIRSGDHDFILAGGMESFSTAPRRLSKSADGKPDVEYKRPPFSPWPDKDPDMLDAAAELAKELSITRIDQELYARKSHAKALAASNILAEECLEISSLKRDSFTRNLNRRVQAKLPVLAGDEKFGITASTTAVEADAAAACAIVSDKFLAAHPNFRSTAIQILGGFSVGSDPAMPGLAPVSAVKKALNELSLNIVQIDVVEVMEAFASQAFACMKLCDMDASKTNLSGGALARGHPIGASGTINAVRLYHELIARSEFKLGLATIAGAGGLGSALVLAK